MEERKELGFRQGPYTGNCCISSMVADSSSSSQPACICIAILAALSSVPVSGIALKAVAHPANADGAGTYRHFEASKLICREKVSSNQANA
eukprot:2412597-Pleurochrysis_carterae.AAC.1